MRELVTALREKIEDVRPGLRKQALESNDSLRVGNVVLIDFLNRLHGMLDNLERNPAAWRAIESQDATVAHVVDVFGGPHSLSGSGDDEVQLVHEGIDTRGANAA